MHHYPTCNPNYPEKKHGEPPQPISVEFYDGFYIRQCGDCGAIESNLPPEDDPYWDSVR